MTELRILAAGDNHGNTEPLEQLVAHTEGEEFDLIIHTGDLTNTYKQDFRTGVEQLQAIEPYFEQVAERGTLIYIYGNRDQERGRGGDRRHVTEGYELAPGHRLPKEGAISVDGYRFCSDPEDTGPNDILVTHAPREPVFYNHPGRAYFSGDTHSARQWETALNTGYLFKNEFQGAYFTATLSGDGLEVDVQGVEEPWRAFTCEEHAWYGRQFAPAKFGCEICKFGPTRTFRGMAHFACEHALERADGDQESVPVGVVTESARQMFVDSEAFLDSFDEYLRLLAENSEPHPTDPLRGVEGERLALNEW